MPSPDIVKEFIASIDRDGSGMVDAKELMAALEGSGIEEKHVKQFIAQHDKDGDGKLNLQELNAFLESCDL